MKHFLGSKTATILIATVLFWASVVSVYAFHQRKVSERRGQDAYKIASIASVARSIDALPHCILASLLDLSESSCLYDEKIGRWEQCPAILHARTWPMPPHTIGVEYKLREPAASLGGVKNIALDDRGIVFFIAPFFAPKRLPLLNIDLGAAETLTQVQQAVAHSKEAFIGTLLIKKLSCLATKLRLTLSLVDMSSWAEANFFRKEVILAFSHPLMPEKMLYIRIHPKYLQQSVEQLEILLPKFTTPAFCAGVLDMRFEGKILCSGEVRAAQYGHL